MELKREIIGALLSVPSPGGLVPSRFKTVDVRRSVEVLEFVVRPSYWCYHSKICKIKLRSERVKPN
jgi:hypothetical protein